MVQKADGWWDKPERFWRCTITQTLTKSRPTNAQPDSSTRNPNVIVEPRPITRLSSLDAFRGVAALAVVLIHVSSHALGNLEGLENLGNPEARFAVVIFNRASQFAVPAFLFLTALVTMRSSLKTNHGTLGFYRSKLKRVLVPYLIWSGLYGLFRVLTTELTLTDLQNPERWRDWLLGGDAYYHLYYLVVALEFYAIFPLVRRWGLLPVAPALAGLIGLQIAAYWLNRTVIQGVAPGSSVLNYLVPLGLGLMVGARLEAWFGSWQRWRLALVALTALAMVLYLPDAVLALEGVPVDTFAHAAATWFYTGACALLLLGTCMSLNEHLRGRSSGMGVFGFIGQQSLQVYLIHPAVIVVLSAAIGGSTRFVPILSTQTPEFWIKEIAILFTAVLVPLVLAWMLEGSKLSRCLFGR